MQEIGQIGEEAVRRIIRTVQECSEVVKYHRKQASKQTIKARKQRNERIGNFPQRKNAWLARTYIGIPNFIQETDQN
jgi:hypothetical protein